MNRRKCSRSAPENFTALPREERGVRCLTCNFQNSCEFYFNITENAFMDTYYLQAEQHDGYIRDGCVFNEEYEGWKAVLLGNRGRLEAEEFFSGPHSSQTVQEIRIYDENGVLQTIPVPSVNGDHGGSDEQLRRAIFAGDKSDPLREQAGSWAGAMSLLIGAAANLSIANKKTVAIKDLLEF